MGVSIIGNGDEIRRKLAKKQGMNAGSNGKSILNQFTNTSSWFWTYSLAPPESALEWANENGKEFVPLVNLKDPLPCPSRSAFKKMWGGKGKKYHCNQCSFHKETCTVDMLVEALNETKNKVTTRYLMGYNEPYTSHDTKDAK